MPTHTIHTPAGTGITKPTAAQQISPWAHTTVLAALLYGSLFPVGVPFGLAATVLAIPMITWQVLRALPLIHPAVCLAVPVFGVLALPTIFGPPILTVYGTQKIHVLFTATLLSALAASLIRDRRDLHLLAVIWAAAGCLLAVTTITGGYDGNGRAVGLGVNPIWLARGIGSAAVAVVWLWRQHLIRRLAAVPILALLAAAMYLTGSRGPLMATFAAVAFLIVSSGPARAARAVMVAVWAGLAVGLAMAFPTSGDSRISSFLTDPGNGLDSSTRPKLLAATWPLIGDHPFGVGYGMWQWNVGGPFRYPHNLWVEVTVEAGWLVGAALVAAAVWCVVRLWRRAAVDPAAALALALLTFEIVSVSVSGDVNARTFFAMLTLGYLVSGSAPSFTAGRMSNGEFLDHHRRPGQTYSTLA